MRLSRTVLLLAAAGCLTTPLTAVPSAAAAPLPAPARPALTAAHTARQTAAPAAVHRVSARTLLGRVAVRAETHNDSYERAAFPHWADADGDGCDTRREVLIIESRTPVTRTPSCVLHGGRWLSSYDGVSTTAYGTFDVDHVVALAEAWGSGAAAWKAAKRLRFANDLSYDWTLQAVTAASNRAKGTKDPAQWLPARSRCAYAIRWTAVKVRWQLSMDLGERAALRRILAGPCGARPVVLPSPGS